MVSFRVSGAGRLRKKVDKGGGEKSDLPKFETPFVEGWWTYRINHEHNLHHWCAKITQAHIDVYANVLWCYMCLQIYIYIDASNIHILIHTSTLKCQQICSLSCQVPKYFQESRGHRRWWSGSWVFGSKLGPWVTFLQLQGCFQLFPFPCGWYFFGMYTGLVRSQLTHVCPLKLLLFEWIWTYWMLSCT